MKIIRITSFIIIILISNYSCNNVPENKSFGKLELVFSHSVYADTFNYVNEAGNRFMISEIQYFVSDIKLYTDSKDTIVLDKYKDIHYVDTDIPD